METIDSITEKMKWELDYYEWEYKWYKYIINRWYWHLNWYVLLKPNHKFYWLSYNNLYFIDVHWWLTFSKDINNVNNSIPKNKYWWLWFDTWHTNDAYAYNVNWYNLNMLYWTYKNYNYVLNEVYQLINQIDD